MAASTDHPQTAPERLIARTIECTWLFWLLGALYIVGPVLGWLLALWALGLLYLQRGAAIPGTVWLWLAGMAAMLVVLWIGHANFALGPGQTIKSSIGWAKGWALLALFPLAGAVLQIRATVIARAVCRLGVQTLILLPLFLIAPAIGLPGMLYVSPLSAVGGPGPEYFATILYTIEPGVGTARWQFFAPWSPAAGMIGIIYVLLAAREPQVGWRMTGIAAGIAIALFSQSRLALVALALVVPMVIAVARVDRPSSWLLAAPLVMVLGIFGPTLIELADTLMNEFSAARADSSRVRAALGRIALERWANEAYWFGHGVVENGPHLVEYMPIGSHHSWYGLLFVKGLVGLLALALPLTMSVAVLALRARFGALWRSGLAMALVLVLYSFGENLEILAYLFWPALIVIGTALGREPERVVIRQL